jgi:haloalkane dehalogenase
MTTISSIVRPSETQFASLTGYPFAPHYLEVNGVRIHYVDEGQGDIVLCLHGEPSWSYLYRKMIPILAQNHRVIAPDWIGFGKSDKYTDVDAYSFQMHRDTLVALMDRLDLHDITLVVQDWGGLIGLRVAGEMPNRFARLVIMNTGMPDGTEPMPEALRQWREFSGSVPDLPIGMVIRLGTSTELSAEVIAAYDAPFTDVPSKAGARAFPNLIPVTPDFPGAVEMRAARESLKNWAKPALLMFSDNDPITQGGDRFFLKLIPHAQKIDIHGAGHFLQEDKGELLAGHILNFLAG